MWALIVGVPDHRRSLYFANNLVTCRNFGLILERGRTSFIGTCNKYGTLVYA